MGREGMVGDEEEAKEGMVYGIEFARMRDFTEAVVRRLGDAICIYLYEDMRPQNPLKTILWRALRGGTTGSVTQRKLAEKVEPASNEEYNEVVPPASEAALAVRVLSLMAKRGECVSS